MCSLPGSPHPSDVSASLCWAFLQSYFKNSSPPWMQYMDNEWDADFTPWSVDQTALHTHPCTLPTSLHPLTFAVFRESRPLCSSLPPFQASAPVPSNLLTHQKAFFFSLLALFYSPPECLDTSLHFALRKATIKIPLEAVLHPAWVCGTGGLAPPFSGATGPSEGRTDFSSPPFFRCEERIQWGSERGGWCWSIPQ